MSLLDKVKETAQKGADLAKDGVKAGQDKLDTIKVEKKITELKTELGGIVYSQKIGTPAENADAEVERIVAEITTAQAELDAEPDAATDTATPTPTARHDPGQLEGRERRHCGDDGRTQDRIARDRAPDLVGRQPRPTSRHQSTTSAVTVTSASAAGSTTVERDQPVPTTRAGEHEPESLRRSGCPGEVEGKRYETAGELGHDREVTRGGRQRIETGDAPQVVGVDPLLERPHHERIVAREAESEPRGRARQRAPPPTARFASTASRQRASASSTSASATRGRSSRCARRCRSPPRAAIVGTPRFCASRLSWAAMCTTRSRALKPLAVAAP